MGINNFDKIFPLLHYESEDDFYYLQILQRKKDCPEIGSNSRVIRNYYLKNASDLIKHKFEIIKLCDTFNARASLRLNKRSFEKVAFRAMMNMANVMMNHEFEFCKKVYDRACGECHNDKNPTWIVDIDEVGRKVNDMLLYLERECEPIGVKYVTTIPSKSGFHLITTPFNIQKFKTVYPDIDIHKDNPTNLYIPS